MLTLLSRFPWKVSVSFGFLAIPLLAYKDSTPLLCMWVLAGEKSIYLTIAPFTCGHMGCAF